MRMGARVEGGIYIRVGEENLLGQKLILFSSSNCNVWNETQNHVVSKDI